MPKRPRASAITVVLGWCALFGRALGPIACGGEIDKRCLADLMENGPPAWKKVELFVENIAVTCQEHRVDRTEEGTKTVVTTQNVDWSLCWNRPSGLRFLERRDSGVERRFLHVANPKYRFTLLKRHERDAFQLDSGQRFARKRQQSYDLTEEQFRDFLEAGINVYGIRLDDLLSDKEFRLDRIEYVPDSKAAQKRVLIEWRYLGSEGGRTRRAGGIYSTVLNPQNSWQVDRTEVRKAASTDWGGWKKEVTYQSTEAQIPFPATVNISFSLPRAKLTVESDHTFGKPTTCQRSEQEFSLPYYGIPESALGYPGASWWPRWLVYVACVVALCLAGFYVRSRRSRNHTTQ
jgi:hypothetical protein